MPIRRAILDDTAAICDLARAKIDRWQRMDSDGRVQDLPYTDLTIYERWLHGGAWMSVETGAIWLAHLVGGAGLPFVLEDEGISAYAEAYLSQEQAPYGHHLHIGQFIASDDAARDDMITHLLEEAAQVGRLSVACTAYDEPTIKLYKRYGFSEIAQVRRVNLSPQSATVGFYKVSEHPNPKAGQILDWQMPIGRVESARMHWEQLWYPLWQSVPRIAGRTIHRLHFNASGQDAYVIVQQQLYNPRGAEIFCWTAKAVSSHLLASIRDWSYKAGYRTLSMVVGEKIEQMLGSDIESTPYQIVILARDS